MKFKIGDKVVVTNSKRDDYRRRGKIVDAAPGPDWSVLFSNGRFGFFDEDELKLYVKKEKKHEFSHEGDVLNCPYFKYSKALEDKILKESLCTHDWRYLKSELKYGGVTSSSIEITEEKFVFYCTKCLEIKEVRKK